MTDAGLSCSDKMKIIGGRQVHESYGIFLIVHAAEIKFTVEANEDSVVQSVRETRRSEGNIIGSFTLLARQWDRQGLKGHQRLNARSTDNFAGAVLNIICGKAKELDRFLAN